MDTESFPAESVRSPHQTDAAPSNRSKTVFARARSKFPSPLRRIFRSANPTVHGGRLLCLLSAWPGSFKPPLLEVGRHSSIEFRLHVVIHREFVRMRAKTEGIVFLLFHLDPVRDEV